MRIAIVGAGPAGAWAAVCLARAGASVVLFDPSHPREKPCGGGLTRRAIEIVADVLASTNLSSVTVTAARIEVALPISTPARSALEVVTVPLAAHDLARADSLVVTSRAAFDGVLVKAAVDAGAHLVPERVVDVAAAQNRVTVRTSGGQYEADFLLGADGATSIVRRRLGCPLSRADVSIGTGFFVHGVTSSDIVIRCIAEQPGYLWSFPRPDHLAVGICAQADESVTVGRLREQTRAWIGAFGISGNGRLDAYSWPIPSLTDRAFDQARVSGARWMLLGDAAGLVDPLTREGIYYALLSGQWAARALLEDSAGAPAAYRARVADEMYPELRRAARLKEGFFRPKFSHLLVEALGQSGPLRHVMADLISGDQPYRGLRRRLLGTQEWGIAWKTLKSLRTRGE